AAKSRREKILPAAAEAAISPEKKVYRAVLDGNAEAIGAAVAQALEAKIQPMHLLENVLIPAINEVGEKYEKKEYFLPQLISGAEAMQTAAKLLEPLLTDTAAKPNRTRILFATVRGDIHDIGKNIVIVMLKNYGFDVLDLGKDVPPEVIIDTAVREKIKIIALSALMTTTMKSMRETVELAKKRHLEDLHFSVGGAVVEGTFAREIGAHYAADPMATIRAAREITALQ
ncbi:MAG: cobalamin-dependent protein, partial [Victivallaceae bacterium]|nr:cobalamin-dependent protein [Victivallaceae bacterium]